MCAMHIIISPENEHVTVRLTNKRAAQDKEIDQSEENTLKPFKAQMNT